MNLNNLKIGTRLAAGFSFVLALTIVIGLAAINRMSAINDASTDLATNWLYATRALSDYQAAINIIRRAEAQHVMSTKESDFAQWEKRIDEGKAMAAEAMKRYEPTVETEDERLLLNAIKAAEKAYYDTQPGLLKTSRQADGATEAVRTAYNGESRTSLATLMSAIEKDLAFQMQGGDAAYLLSQKTYQNTRIFVLMALVVAVAIGGGAAWVITRSITHPMAEAVRLTDAAAAGDLTNDIRVNRSDEVGQLLRSLATMNANLGNIVAQVRQGSEAVAAASAQIAQGNQDLSARTESQASSLEETAASMEELSSTVKQNAQNAQQANQLAQSASTVAIDGGQVVSEVVDTMRGISTSSNRIADIITVIDGIAFQTNILALNAAVEAARAGEQGRGFAVVASEVRSLAGRSAEAAKEIKTLITESVERVERGTQLVDKAGNTMQEVVNSIRRVTDIMGEISAASAEQSAGVGQVGEAVIQMDQATQQNAALVEEMAAAAGSLNNQAQAQVKAVSVFKLSASQAMSTVTSATPVKAPARVSQPAPKTAAPATARVAAPKAVKPIQIAAAAMTKAPSPMANSDADWDTF